MRITHFLFVDDLIPFGVGLVDECCTYHSILDIFCKATCMLIGGTKYSFLEYEMDEEGIRETKYLFPNEVNYFDEGFKYFNYHLKPNNYLKED